MKAQPRHILALALAGGLLAVAAPAASAQTPFIDGSPLNVYADGQGALQFRYDGQTDGIFYDPSSNAAHAGLELIVNGAHYDLGNSSNAAGPTLASPSAGTQTLTSQYTMIDGSGGNGVTVDETLVYTDGTQQVEVHYAITNTSAAAETIRAGELADLYVSGDDQGTGVFSPGPPRFIGGRANGGTTVTGLYEVQGSGWQAYQESEYGAIFENFDSDVGLNNTYDPNLVDNGVGVQWELDNVAPGETRQLEAIWSLNGTAPPGSNPVATPIPIPTPVPTPVPTPTPVPPPVAGKSVNVEVEGGKVRLKLPGSNTFVDLGPGQQIPLGTTIDTTAGRIGITAAANKSGATQNADFYDGIFKITQTGGAKPVTDLALNGPKPSCGKAKSASAAAKKPKTRKLWGDGSGSFRTRGQFSSATVRGTVWLTQDSCAGTLTKVKRGVVSVQDLVKHKTVLVKAGHQYLARPRKH
jgi:hypothetical protein